VDGVRSGFRIFAPQGAKACSLGRQPQVTDSTIIPEPRRGDGILPRSDDPPSPLRGSGIRCASLSWGSRPRLHAFAPCGARTLLLLFFLALPLAAAPLAYVTNELAGTVTIFDTATNKVVSTVTTGARPRGLQLTADGKRLYVALSDIGRTTKSSADAIVAVDAATFRPVARFDAGSDPERFVVTRDRLYAANEDAGTATVTEIAKNKVIASLIVGIEPEGVALSPNGRWVYVTAETSNTVSVIDTRSLEVVSTFLVDPRPRVATFSPDGKRAYVTAEIGGTLAVVDAVRHKVLRTIKLPPTAKPVGVVVSPDGKRIYVANGHGNSVSVIDAATEKLTATVPVGKRPWGIAVTRDGKRIYTANGVSNDISVIDAATLKVIATIPAGKGAWGVVIGR